MPIRSIPGTIRGNVLKTQQIQGIAQTSCTMCGRTLIGRRSQREVGLAMLELAHPLNSRRATLSVSLSEGGGKDEEGSETAIANDL